VHAIVSVGIRAAVAIIEMSPHSSRSPLPRVPDYGGRSRLNPDAVSDRLRKGIPSAECS
jgi:hypothetical protein